VSEPVRIRAVATDLDGTIVRPDGTVSEATREAVRKLREAEIPLIVATARTPAGLSAIEPLGRQVDLAVCCNGSLGYRPSDSAVLWRYEIDPAVLKTVITALRGYLPDAGFGVYDGQEWTLTRLYRAAGGSWPRGPRRLAGPGQIAQVKACAMSVCHSRLGPAQIAAVLARAGIGSRQALLSWAADGVLNVAPAGVSKGTGVTRALAHLGIVGAETICFGDAHNDLPMFSRVAVAVAVANAHQDVLAAADVVADSVGNDGFARTLEKFGIIRPGSARQSS
jgi:hydroxymethylpyrimidine pyrophosphatase-like HAD family hydrolase